MDNTSTQSLFKSGDSFMPSNTYSSSNGNGGFLDGLKNINLTTWLLIILILSFLGFNVFAYLAQGTQDITNAFAPLLKAIFGTTLVATGEAVDITAEGAKIVVDKTAKVIDTGLTAIQDITPNGAPSSIKGQTVSGNQQPPNQPPVDTIQQSTLNRVLNTAQQTQQPQQQDYQANEASSSVHSAGKAGWCYVGNDRGFRTCAEVGVNDTCMSGDIFPTQEICMNPNLRY